MAENVPTDPFVKKSKTITLRTALLAGVVVALVAYVLGTRADELGARFRPSPNASAPASLDFSSLNDVYSVLRKKYDGKLDAQALIDGAKHGLVEATGDPYTVYFTAKEAEEFQADLDGSFQGIGAELGKRTDKLTVINTLEDSPARRAGLQAGDVIVKVNDQDATQWSVDEAVSKIRGDKGTVVKLSVLRADEGLKDFSITREAITNPSVRSEITADNIGILRISRFGTDTASLSRAAAEEFKSKNVRGVILDMRGNGGGYLDAAKDIASIWLDNKVVVSERTNGVEVDSLRSASSPILAGVKTVVLVDGGSASASEIVAGALADHGAATLVGEKTFGKGSVQVFEDVASGGKVKVTIAKWYTPKGRNITKEGIEPTEKVGLTIEDVNAGRDPQKDKALELLRR